MGGTTTSTDYSAEVAFANSHFKDDGAVVVDVDIEGGQVVVTDDNTFVPLAQRDTGSSLVSDFFGLNNLTKNYGVIYLGFGLGSIIGSIVASLFGGFMATFNLLLVLLVVALVLSLTIRLPAPVAAVDRA